MFSIVPKINLPPINVQDFDVLILCGGQGNRFREVRDDIPKVLAPIKSKAFLDLLLDDLLTQGFKRFILATGYLSEQIEMHVGDRYDAEYVISRESKPLGTGGAVKFAETKFQSDPVLVMNGDSRIEFDFKKFLGFHLSQKADLTLLLSSKTQGKNYGHVELDSQKQLIAFHEKMEGVPTQIVNAGVYLMNPKLLYLIIAGKSCSLEKDLLPEWTNHHRIFGMVTDQHVYDIGTAEGYFTFEKILQR